MAGGKRSQNQTGEKSTSGGASTLEPSDLCARIKAANEALQPAKCYVINGDARTLEFANGVVIDLENRNPAVVIMVLSKEQAKALPEGTRDVTEL